MIKKGAYFIINASANSHLKNVNVKEYILEQAHMVLRLPLCENCFPAPDPLGTLYQGFLNRFTENVVRGCFISPMWRSLKSFIAFNRESCDFIGLQESTGVPPRKSFSHFRL